MSTQRPQRPGGPRFKLVAAGRSTCGTRCWTYERGRDWITPIPAYHCDTCGTRWFAPTPCPSCEPAPCECGQKFTGGAHSKWCPAS